MGNVELIAQVLCALQVGISTNVLATSKGGTLQDPGGQGSVGGLISSLRGLLCCPAVRWFEPPPPFSVAVFLLA